VVWRASRYGKGEAAYLNCPMTRDEYHAFVEDLATAELSP
jgi:methylenetetrahydrofolate--tRNA-(uracil-5-)-methyltransferase